MRTLFLLALLPIAGAALAAEPPCRGGDVQVDAAGATVGDMLTQLAAAHGVLLRGPVPSMPAPAGLQGDLLQVLERLLRGTSHAIVCADGKPSQVVIIGMPQEMQPAAAAPTPDAPRWTPRDD